MLSLLESAAWLVSEDDSTPLGNALYRLGHARTVHTRINANCASGYVLEHRHCRQGLTLRAPAEAKLSLLEKTLSQKPAMLPLPSYRYCSPRLSPLLHDAAV